MKNWLIVLTFFSLWISTMFSENVQQVLAYVLILSVGVLHGANDINLINLITRGKKKKSNFYKVLAYYLSTVILILGVFSIYPPLALFLFIIISGYHFGEQHFKGKVLKEVILTKLFYFFYGLTILFMIFHFNMNKTNPIFLEVIGFSMPDSFFRNILIAAVSGLVLCFLLVNSRKVIIVNVVEEIFYLLILMVVFKVADLLWAFSIYFILWHSIPSLKDQIEMLYGKFEIKGLLKYLKTSWAYWLTSIIGLIALFLIFKDNKEFFISILIYFLAAITFPHVIVMSKLEKN
ncbi:Brp/Blh family beta-carotene 15,15'-dioxygenase [Croceitalea rosinachiae]|uniref:Probable beta-carotene 15,15'-dioxygenase n=1 Tax=Croceitalea rosinachiae TaxID=3075596 RepID=A0ABU3ACR5_9FLAO|nr:Brp/Blh family beta-carotene 15,15'-dioxygenase [Croceitalea sp. F388]MDT0607974.1 Brp/Blh family beta-carotene 15,15'-dioxygenase [Croceitalea sp. F388]